MILFLFWFFFSLALCVLSLSLSLLISILCFFLLFRLCLFACVSFLICCSKGEGLASVFLSLFLFFLCLYSLIFLHWVLFFFVFLLSCVCSPSLLPFVCIIHSLCSVCHFVSVPCSCFCSSSGFPLLIPGVLSVFFPFLSFFS